MGAVWPLLQAQLGDSVRLHVVGACSSPAINALASRSIILHGTVTDLGAHFNSARVFVVPTRYAAGIAHKAHEAAAFGLPMVTTALIAEQLCWSDVVAVGADAAGFAQASAALYNEPDRWQSARDRALEAVLIDCAPVLFEAATLAAVEGRMPPARHALMSEDQ